jgi:hypothetical protein
MVTDGSNLLLFVRTDGALAITHLVIYFAVEKMNQLQADGPFYPTRHVIIEMEHATLLFAIHLGTEQGTLVLPDQSVAQVDGLQHDGIFIDMLSDEPVQARFMATAPVVEAYHITGSLLAEDVSLLLCGRL